MATPPMGALAALQARPTHLPQSTVRAQQGCDCTQRACHNVTCNTGETPDAARGSARAQRAWPTTRRHEKRQRLR
eukprot:9318671-Alexandrium_andersonii.AAC.1